MPPSAKTPCEEHSERLRKIEEHAQKNESLFEMVKDIRVAVCGNHEMGIPGLITLHEKVASLERQRTWLLGAAAVVGAVFPFVWNIFVK